MATMTELESVMAQLGATMVKSQQEWAITRKELADSHRDMERTFEKQNAETSAKIAETSAKVSELSAVAAETSAKVSELSAVAAETSAKVSELSAVAAETSAVVAETSAKVAEVSAIVDKWVGYFGNKIGYIVESILVPGIKERVNDYGHNFTKLLPRAQYFRVGGKRLAEVDLLLENGDEAMAVEVKTRLLKSDVENHLKRLKLLRENEATSGLKGKTLYSAVAALVFDDDARELALSLGMYVVEMVEETKHVSVIKPSVELGRW